MKSPRRSRPFMVTLAFLLPLIPWHPAAAAPAKKPPAPAAVVQEAPPPPTPKPNFLQKLNPFRKKEPPPAPLPPKNSKKSPAAPAKPTAGKPSAATPRQSLPPVAVPSPASSPPADTPDGKKSSFFSRLKAKLDGPAERPATAGKPDRPADWQDRWVITDDSTAFFEFGPSQAGGPDLRLPRGQVVKLTQANRGWARVELASGRQGYLGTDQIRQAALSDFAAPPPAPPAQLAAFSGKSVPQGWSPMAPPPDLPDLPMPAGSDASLLLLPPLEYEGTELKKSSLKLPREQPPTLLPGDPLPAPSEPVPPLKLEDIPSPAPSPAPAAPPESVLDLSIPSPNAPAAPSPTPPTPPTPEAPNPPPATP